jgi:hypothetical protein
MTRVSILALAVSMALGTTIGQARAQSPPAPAPAAAPATEVSAAAIRLFERFVEDAVMSPFWAEFDYLYDNGEDSEANFLGPVIAFRVSQHLEAGTRFGYKEVKSETLPEGSGLSDIDLYLKYVTAAGRSNRWAFGGILKAPTADEDEGLGTGKTDVELFGAWRHGFGPVAFTANLAFRYNGSAETAAGDVDDTWLAGIGLIAPASPRIAAVIEAAYETERFEGGEGESSSLSAGIQVVGRSGRGGYRVTVGLPLTDGASDLRILAGAYCLFGQK